MKHLLYILLCGIALGACSPFSMYRIPHLHVPPTDSLRAERINLEEYQKKYAQYDGVFLLREETITQNAVGDYGWGLVKIRRLRFLILNPEAEWLSTFNISLNSDQELKSAYIHIANPQQDSIRTFGMKDLKLAATTRGGTSYKFAYPDIKVGSVIEEGFLTHSYHAYGDDNDVYVPLQFSVPCEQLKISISYPKWWKVKVKELGTDRPVDYALKLDGFLRIIDYTRANVPALADEPYAPFPNELGAYIEASDPRFSTWTTLADKFAMYAMGSESSWKDDVQEVTETIVKGIDTDREKLEKIVAYVQDTIKVTKGQYRDDVASVLERKEGNIILVNALARAMLQSANIDSTNLVLIHAADDGYFDSTYISFSQLRTPGVTATIDGRLYVVFPYMKNLPVGLIPTPFQGQQAMIITTKGFGGFIKIPDDVPQENTIDNTYTLNIDEEGSITVVEEKTLRGSNAFIMRERLADFEGDELRDAVKNLLTYSEGDVTLMSHEIINRNEYNQPLVIKFQYTIDNLVTVTPEEVIFQTAGLFSPASSGKTKVKTEDRRNPIRIYFPETLNKTITINHPSNWTLTTPLTDVTAQNKFGSINGTYTMSPGQLQITHVRMLNKMSAPKEEANELLAVVGLKSRLQVPSLVFRVDR